MMLNRRLLTTVPLLLAISAHQAMAQDAGAGEKVFAKCKICHQVGTAAKNAMGPELNGLFGRKAGSVAGYKYSPAMAAAGFTWDETAFTAFLKNPKAKVPGTKMMAGNIQDEAQIANLAAYLKQFDAGGNKTP